MPTLRTFFGSSGPTVDNRDASVVATGGGVLATVNVKGGQGDGNATGGGVYTHSYTRSAKNADLSAVITGGGIVVVSGRKGGQSPLVTTGGGIVASTRLKNAQATVTL